MTQPTISLTPATAAPGVAVTVKGSGFGSSRTVALTVDDIEVLRFTTGSAGSFTRSVSAPAQAGAHVVAANSTKGCGKATLTVVVLAPPPPPFDPSVGAVWFDDFTGDLSKWRISNYGATGSGRKCCGDEGANFADQVAISGGMLHLKATKVNGVWRRGCIDTETKFLAGFGIWEARIKCPTGNGFWPAWWGYATGGEEIDVLEGGKAVAMQGVHRYDGSPRNPAIDTPMAIDDGFHIYGVEYRASGIQFSIDGVKRGALAAPLANSSKMPLILNLGVGNAAWSKVGSTDATTPTSAEMLVDWVRVMP